MTFAVVNSVNSVRFVGTHRVETDGSDVDTLEMEMEVDPQVDEGLSKIKEDKKEHRTAFFESVTKIFHRGGKK